MRRLNKEERDFFNYLREKCTRVKSSGYIHYLDYKNNKKYKRSRVLFQIYNNVKLSPSEIVHHKDRNRENDRITNLELTNIKDHTSHHFTGKRNRKNKPRRKSNKLNQVQINKIFKLAKKQKYKFGKKGKVNYSKIGKEIGISGMAVAKYLND